MDVVDDVEVVRASYLMELYRAATRPKDKVDEGPQFDPDSFLFDGRLQQAVLDKECPGLTVATIFPNAATLAAQLGQSYADAECVHVLLGAVFVNRFVRVFLYTEDFAETVAPLLTIYILGLQLANHPAQVHFASMPEALRALSHAQKRKNFLDLVWTRYTNMIYPYLRDQPPNVPASPQSQVQQPNAPVPSWPDFPVSGSRGSGWNWVRPLWVSHMQVWRHAAASLGQSPLPFDVDIAAVSPTVKIAPALPPTPVTVGQIGTDSARHEAFMALRRSLAVKYAALPRPHWPSEHLKALAPAAPLHLLGLPEHQVHSLPSKLFVVPMVYEIPRRSTEVSHERQLNREILAGSGRVLLLGEAGIGKTTTLHQLAYWVNGDDSAGDPTLMIIIDTADYTQLEYPEPLSTYAAGTLADMGLVPDSISLDVLENYLAEWSAAGRVIWGIDGIDWFSVQHAMPLVRILASTPKYVWALRPGRLGDLRQLLTDLANFPTPYELQPFDDLQARTYCVLYLRALADANSQHRGTNLSASAERLYHEIAERRLGNAPLALLHAAIALENESKHHQDPVLNLIIDLMLRSGLEEPELTNWDPGHQTTHLPIAAGVAYEHFARDDPRSAVLGGDDGSSVDIGWSGHMGWPRSTIEGFMLQSGLVVRPEGKSEYRFFSPAIYETLVALSYLQPEWIESKKQNQVAFETIHRIGLLRGGHENPQELMMPTRIYKRMDELYAVGVGRGA